MIRKPNSLALIVGASGQVGSQITSALATRSCLLSSRKAPNSSWISLDLARLQSDSELERLFSGVELNSIYCVGGMTNVESCEVEVDRAMRSNCIGPALLAKFCHKRDLPFVYFSTEYIFDGLNGPYDEESTAQPLSVYGRSKWEGELAVQANNQDALIVRTTVVYGPDQGGKNFLYGLRRALVGGQVFKVPEDQVSTPTYNRDLARVTVGLMMKRESGVFHVCGPERMSRLELSQRAAKFWGLDASNIHGVATASLGQKAARPLEAGLNIRKLQTRYPDLPTISLEASLADWDNEAKGC
jgi:dTDP-4-dehydrorhamnose reductase